MWRQIVVNTWIMMKIILTISADVLKLANLLSKFSTTHKLTYKLQKKKKNDSFIMEASTDDFGELVRRLNHLKGCKFDVQEISGGGWLDKINVSLLTKTNVDALIGMISVAQNDIDPIEGGLVKLKGEQWFCRPVEEKPIKKDSRVRIVSVDGVSLIVEEVK